MTLRMQFRCPQCEAPQRAEVSREQRAMQCKACGKTWEIPNDAFEGERLTRCLACPCTDLFVRKDFPQRLGVAIVVAGLAASCVPWYFKMPIWTYAILFSTALLDVVLYFIMGNALQCYRCQAIYRGLDRLEEFAPFELETHERHRQQKIRLAETAPAAARKVPLNGARTNVDS